MSDRPQRSTSGGFRIDLLSERAGKALIASGWTVQAGFDADCGTCGGSGEWDAGMGPTQCVCGGLLWFPPSEPVERQPRSEIARLKAEVSKWKMRALDAGVVE